MGAFVIWLAGHYEEMRERVQKRVLEMRSPGPWGAGHARTPAAVAELQSGLEIFLEFGVATGAIALAEKQELAWRGARALGGELAARQAPCQDGGEPGLRFVALLRAALGSGRAHVANRQGRVPAEAAAWGWQRRDAGRGWKPRGSCIGWVVDSDLYLEPTVSYHVAQEMAGTERLPVSEAALRRRLREQGLLVSTDAARQMLPVRRTLAGSARKVLHLRASHLLGASV